MLNAAKAAVKMSSPFMTGRNNSTVCENRRNYLYEFKGHITISDHEVDL